VTLSLVLFVAFVIIGVPIAFALGGAALVGLWLYEGAPLRIVASRMFGGIDNFSLLAIPFFILAGELMETGGISQRLVTLARVLVGHIRGGLGNVVMIAMIFFSGISGSTNADAAAIGSVMIPPMKRQGYSAGHAGAIVAAAAGMGILVPPCLTMVVYGSITNTSIATLFAAGFLPAFIMTAALMIHLRIDAKRLGLTSDPACPLEPAPEGALRGLLGAAPAGHHIRRHLGRRVHADRGRSGRGRLRHHRRHGGLPRD
jgi:C4-dicarboxylate transporter DctM subunit